MSPLCGATDTGISEFWQYLLWVSKLESAAFYALDRGVCVAHSYFLLFLMLGKVLFYLFLRVKFFLKKINYTVIEVCHERTRIFITDAPRRWHWRTSPREDSDSEPGVLPIGRGTGLPATSRHPQQQPHHKNQTETSVPVPPRTRHPQQQTHHKDQTETSVPKAYNRNWANVLPRLN